MWITSSDERHPDPRYLARAERIASWVTAISLFALSIYLVGDSTLTFLTRTQAEASWWGVGLAIAAAIIAAVRLAKVVDLELSFDKVKTVVTQSVFLARTILDEAKQRF